MKEKYERTQQSHLASEWVQSGEDSCGEDDNTTLFQNGGQ